MFLTVPKTALSLPARAEVLDAELPVRTLPKEAETELLRLAAVEMEPAPRAVLEPRFPVEVGGAPKKPFSQRYSTSRRLKYSLSKRFFPQLSSGHLR